MWSLVTERIRLHGGEFQITQKEKKYDFEFFHVVRGNQNNSASADGGLAPRVRARGTLRSDPHRH